MVAVRFSIMVTVGSLFLFFVFFSGSSYSYRWSLDHRIAKRSYFSYHTLRYYFITVDYFLDHRVYTNKHKSFQTQDKCDKWMYTKHDELEHCKITPSSLCTAVFPNLFRPVTQNRIPTLDRYPLPNHARTTIFFTEIPICFGFTPN